MSVPLTPDSYRPHIESEFVAQLEDGSTRSLKLTSVKPSIDDDVQLSFSLLFTSPGKVLPQHLYRVSHAALGQFDLFLVPIQPRRSGLVYEAVFNLLKDEAQ